MYFLQQLSIDSRKLSSSEGLASFYFTMGENRFTITIYQLLKIICHLIRNGLAYFSTNVEEACPPFQSQCRVAICVHHGHASRRHVSSRSLARYNSHFKELDPHH